MVVKVCVGSSCHLKGSYDVIESFKAILKKYDVEDLVDLQATFCLGHCATGVTVQAEELDAAAVEKLNANELLVHHVSAENVESIFVNEIKPLLSI